MNSYFALREQEALYLQLGFTMQDSSAKLSAHFFKRVNYTYYLIINIIYKGFSLFLKVSFSPLFSNREINSFSPCQHWPYLHMSDYNCIRKLLLN